jgi:uncharacterized repeat protein (TIGR01451 family)
VTYCIRLLAVIAIAAAGPTAAGPFHQVPVDQVPRTGGYPQAWPVRFASQGWAGFLQTGAAVLTCPAPDPAPGCAAPTDAAAPTHAAPTGAAALKNAAPAPTASWIDVDADASTANSNTAFLTLPPGASVDWAGLTWGGDRGGSTATAAPPNPDRADRVQFSINDGPYIEVTSSSLIDVTAPDGRHGFQAQADVTAMVRPLTSPAHAVPIAVTVADIQVAEGVGYVGGWAMTVAYSYPDGPNGRYAPQYRTLVVADGALALPAGVTQQVRIDALALPRDDPPDARIGLAVLASDTTAGPHMVGVEPVVTGSGAVAGSAAVAGPGASPAGPATAGYRVQAANLPTASLHATSAVLNARSPRGGYLAATVVVTARMSVRVDLALTASVVPDTVPVGGTAVVTVCVRNGSPVPATGVRVAAPLPDGVVMVTSTPSYDARSGVWQVGSVPAHGSLVLSLRVRVERAGTLDATTEVSSADLPDVDSTPNDRAADEDDLAVIRLSATEASQGGPSPVAGAVVADGTDEGGSWPSLASTLLIGSGLFLLGLVMALVLVLRHEPRT